MTEVSARLIWPPLIHELAETIRSLPDPPSLYLVGGAVRDAYLGRALGEDIDIAVAGDAIGMARKVADALKGDIYVMDRERGVARVFVKRGGGAATIDFAKMRGATLEDDLRDRDFTMNAMAADLLGDPGALIDPLGGVGDLRRKALRRCSPGAIANDPIRALRAVRLSAQFELKIQPETAADIRKGARDLAQSSPERVRDEFFKLLGLDRAARGLRALAHLGVLEMILPQLYASPALQPAPQGAEQLARALAVVERLSAIIKSISRRRTDNTAAAFDLGTLVIQLDRFRPSLQAHLDQRYGTSRSQAQLLVLAALLSGIARADEAEHGGSRSAYEIARSLRLSREEGRKLGGALRHQRDIVEKESRSALEQHRFWRGLGESGIDAILLGLAAVMGARAGASSQRDWLTLVDRATVLLDAYFNRHAEIVDPKPLLDGIAVQQLLGLAPGPKVGRLLMALREAQAAGDLTTQAEARDFALRSAASSDQPGGNPAAQACAAPSRFKKR